MEMDGITWSFEKTASKEDLRAVPDYLAKLLSSINGFVLWGGALHVRGLCSGPDWHSLDYANHPSSGFAAYYPDLQAEDIFFAEDCVGDQYFLRDDQIFLLSAETGECDLIASQLEEFVSQAMEDPVEFLGMHPLLQINSDGTQLAPGQLIHVYPPFCTKEASNGVSLQAVSSKELYAFHSEFASKLGSDGSNIQLDITQ